MLEKTPSRKRPKKRFAISLQQPIHKNWACYCSFMLLEEDPEARKLYTTIYNQYRATYNMLYKADLADKSNDKITNSPISFFVPEKE